MSKAKPKRASKQQQREPGAEELVDRAQAQAEAEAAELTPGALAKLIEADLAVERAITGANEQVDHDSWVDCPPHKPEHHSDFRRDQARRIRRRRPDLPEIPRRTGDALADLDALADWCASAGAATGTDEPPPALGKTAARVYELLRSVPPHRAMTGPEILDHLAYSRLTWHGPQDEAERIIVDEATLRKHHLPALEPYGLEHTPRIGYRLKPRG